jgi:ATPase family AAA domain-containing protein 3A/B
MERPGLFNCPFHLYLLFSFFAEEEIQNERRRTEEHRAKLERENMRARAVAEAEGRIKEQRENEEIHQRQLRLRLLEERQTKIDSINAYFRHLGEAANSFLTDPSKIGAAALAVSAVFLGIWGTREGVRVVGRAIEKRIGTPPLVRDTSRLTNHFALRKRLARSLGLGSSQEEGYSFSDVILRQEISDRISRLSTSVSNTKANGAPFRHMLFYGPPGTGKTMVAKRLARSTGLDYAIMSGGDVGPLGRDAVTELHRLFDWANTSKRGLLLFIDEADAFLASRSRSNMSEDQRNALNALLYRTGENSKNFMMVLATNRPGDLDRAVADRVDEAMVFDLPDLPARKKLVKQYYNKFIIDAGKEAKWGPFGLFSRPGARITIGEGIDDAYLDNLAARLEGFSGREISKLFISVQGDVYGRPAPRVLTKQILEEVVSWKLKEHADKDKFSTDASFDFVAAGNRGSASSASSAAAAAGSKAADKPLR